MTTDTEALVKICFEKIDEMYAWEIQHVLKMRIEEKFNELMKSGWLKRMIARKMEQEIAALIRERINIDVTLSRIPV